MLSLQNAQRRSTRNLPNSGPALSLGATKKQLQRTATAGDSAAPANLPIRPKGPGCNELRRSGGPGRPLTAAGPGPSPRGRFAIPTRPNCCKLQRGHCPL